MNSLKKIIWLASYPKSGNTWFRVFLSNLLNHSDQPANINNLYATPIASNRELFDDATGISSSELTFDEIDILRPFVYEFYARSAEDLLYQKIHDAWLYNGDKKPMFPSEITKGVIYFIRNPLDVSVSFSHHLGKSNEEVVKFMADSSYSFGSNPNRFHLQIRQRLLTWSEHIRSWVDESGLPIEVIRYEDMKTNTFETFKRAINFLEISATDDEIRKAIGFSDIKVLQEQESQQGFTEKPAKAATFFRKGIVGSWKTELTAEQIDAVCRNHKDMMMRFGYLGTDGKLI
ncbi:sulfotransferase domain-containing protein [Williamwhitmania taraxaci]|uniref:Sulfotransferase domain-containing protein n=1 Tax=Williamwhitmania taraxaci TaxID=1640674 RepID=A0A1G6PRR4_9BACT|nr:sulfotransferase domain-containing protein [Williamwhitmania taraxaci]SDC82196.1 Sulfotransferase domain-containing protein [Williamwhitmania taraxaci]